MSAFTPINPATTFAPREYVCFRAVLGVHDLFWLPVEQYQRDGRIVRGLQRGGRSFMTHTALSTVELTKDVVELINKCAEISYDMVSPTRSRRLPPRYRVKQPADVREGLVNACTIFSEVCCTKTPITFLRFSTRI